MKNNISITQEININLIILEYIIEFLEILTLPKKYKKLISILNNYIIQDSYAINDITNYEAEKETFKVTTYYKKKEV